MHVCLSLSLVFKKKKIDCSLLYLGVEQESYSFHYLKNVCRTFLIHGIVYVAQSSVQLLLNILYYRLLSQQYDIARIYPLLNT